MKATLFSILMLTLCTTTLLAAPTGRIKRDAVLNADSLERWSVGIGYENQTREITIAGDPTARLRANTLFASLSYDVLANASIYAGLNQATADHVGTVGSLGERDDIDWFAGFQLNLWEHMHESTDMFNGRFSLSASVEHANYTAASASGTEAEWDVTVIALPIGFQSFTRDVISEHVDSALFFGGPVMSTIDGDITDGATTTPFDESSDLGVLFGVDVFLNENFVVGGQVQFYDDYSYNFSARYHF